MIDDKNILSIFYFILKKRLFFSKFLTNYQYNKNIIKNVIKVKERKKERKKEKEKLNNVKSNLLTVIEKDLLLFIFLYVKSYQDNIMMDN